MIRKNLPSFSWPWSLSSKRQPFSGHEAISGLSCWTVRNTRCRQLLISRAISMAEITCPLHSLNEAPWKGSVTPEKGEEIYLSFDKNSEGSWKSPEPPM